MRGKSTKCGITVMKLCNLWNRTERILQNERFGAVSLQIEELGDSRRDQRKIHIMKNS
jgi:hypothetical protein